MPLPPAPTKRAALLSTDALDAPARSPSKVARKTENAESAQKPPVLDLFDSRTASGGDHPVAFSKKEPASPAKTSAGSYKKESIAAAQPAVRPKKTKHTGPAKLFVLDTNVLMHDPMCLFRFEEHDIFLPMIVLEELDGHKKGMTEVARNARQTSRTLDALAGATGADIAKGLKLDTTGHREAGGSLFFQTKPLDYTLPMSLPQGKADNQILGVVEALIVASLLINQFVFFEAPGEPPLYARVTEIRAKTAVLKTLKDYNHLKNAVWGVTTRNREQNFAMNLLMDPEVDFVTLAGTAGTGKTLMALASGLTQVLDDRRYTEIIMTRATVSVGEDIGFLPGTEEEKMGPWMGALDDNLEVLGKTDNGSGEWGRAATNELIRSRIKVKSMNFMRGRTFLNKYVIIDEAQNLTPKQMKTLITRAGPGTKIICMGNLAQIDTPYLTEGSSGLTYAVDRFKGWPHGGHITLARGERSRLADFASEVL